MDDTIEFNELARENFEGSLVFCKYCISTLKVEKDEPISSMGIICSRLGFGYSKLWLHHRVKIPTLKEPLLQQN